RLAVSDVPGLDLLEHPRGPGRAHEADADLERQHHEHAPFVVRSEGASDGGTEDVAVDREAEQVRLGPPQSHPRQEMTLARIVEGADGPPVRLFVEVDRTEGIGPFGRDVDVGRTGYFG